MARIQLKFESDLTPFQESESHLHKLRQEASHFSSSMVGAFRESTNQARLFDKELENNFRDLKRVEKQAEGIGHLGRSFQKAGKEAQTFGGEIGKLATGFLAGSVLTTAMSKISDSFSHAIDVQREFEKSIQNLSAITGASGADLDFYSDAAIRLGATIKGGATAAVEAIKLIGSAKPELLENKEALVGVTESAILLSKAAGLELPDAATRLTDAMNQFGASANQADYYVNVLANGAKFGAAEIPEVTDALLKFGVAAKSSNISIVESVAAIELLGEKGLKGAEAGTALRNVFAKMSATDVLPKEAVKDLEKAGVNIKLLGDKSIPLQKRLQELSKIQNDANALTRVFGLENKTAAQAVLQNLERLDQLTGSLETAGGAIEQAAANTDTLEQKTIEASNAWDNFILSITKGSTGDAMKIVVEGWTESLNRFSQVLTGTFGKETDVKNLMQGYNIEAGRAAKLTEEQSRKLVEYGITLDSTSGRLDKAKFGLVDYMFATEGLVKSIDRLGNTEENRKNVISSLEKDAAIFAAQYKAGAISAEDFSVKVKILNGQIQKVKDLGKVPPPVDGKESAEAAEEDKKALEKIKKAREDFEKAMLDLRKRVQKAQLEMSSPAERINLQKQFDLEELDLLKENFIKIGKAKDANFKISIEQEQQFNYLRQAVSQKAADELLKIEIENQNKIAQARVNAMKGQGENLDLKEESAIITVNLSAQPAGVSDVEFERSKQKEILRIQQDFAMQKLEQKKALLNAERDATLTAMNGELDLLKDKNDAESNIKRDNIRTQLAILEEKYLLEGQKAQDETAKLINELQKQVEELDKQSNKFSLAKFLGLTEQEFQTLTDGLKRFGQELYNFFDAQLQAQMNANERQVEESQNKQEKIGEEIDDLESRLDKEQDLQERGLANNTDRLMREIEAKKKAQEIEKQRELELLEERKKIQKQKLLLDSLLQLSNLATASTQIFATLSPLGPLGIATAIATIGLMIGTFVKTKTEALKAINEGQGFFKGVVDLQGPGTETSDSINARLSKGESVMTAKTTREHKPLLEALHAGNDRMLRAALIDELKKTGVVLNSALPKELADKKQSVKDAEMRIFFKNDNTRVENSLKDMNNKFSTLIKVQKDKTYLNQRGDLVHTSGSHTRIVRKNG